MNWLQTVAVVAVAVCVAACGSKSTETPGGPNDGTTIPSGEVNLLTGEISAVPAYNLGDVEVATRVVLQVATQSLTPNVQYEELGTLREKVAVANASVKAPRPSEFWVKSFVESRSAYRAEDAVYLKAEVVADAVAEPLLVNTYVVSGDEIFRKPQTVEFNLMEKLDSIPDSILLQTKLTIVWFPSTSPTTVDAENPDLSKGQVQEKLSNPLRINFE